MELGVEKIVWLNEIWLRFENYQQGENTYEYLWFPIFNFICLKLTIETLEEGAKYVQS